MTAFLDIPDDGFDVDYAVLRSALPKGTVLVWQQVTDEGFQLLLDEALLMDPETELVDLDTGKVYRAVSDEEEVSDGC